MTGEITLRGRILPIGGVKEKVLAAHRAGIEKVLLPKENEKDLAEVKDEIKKGLKIIPIETIMEAFPNVFDDLKKKLHQTNDKKHILASMEQEDLNWIWHLLFFDNKIKTQSDGFFQNQCIESFVFV